MRSCFCLASGLETRNQFQNRQEKNEFYFSSRTKIFLTGKRNARVRGKTKKIAPPDFATGLSSTERQSLRQSDLRIRIAVASLLI
jgi:hypothetical protein